MDYKLVPLISEPDWGLVEIVPGQPRQTTQIKNGKQPTVPQNSGAPSSRDSEAIPEIIQARSTITPKPSVPVGSDLKLPLIEQISRRPISLESHHSNALKGWGEK